jgi:murein tripeptide amidase MpaA
MPRFPRPFFTSLILTLSLAASAAAQFPKGASEAPLPPLPPWKGKSLDLRVAKSDPWVTPFEASDMRRTPTYDETVAWLRKLADASPEVAMVSLGRSPEGRDIWLVIASKERAFTPEALKATGKPSLFAQGGIHSGEIDGKDAGMMLLRDMTVRETKRALLDGANLLFVPIFNVDGHERSSRFNRINQRGPELTGWRTNARNLNLNRDYAKIDTVEMRHMIRALRTWDPSLYLDIHVTDGEDYQYDITYGYNGPWGHSPAIAGWLDRQFSPALERDLRAMGHIPGPLVFGVDRYDITKGISGWTADPRFSNGYGDAVHLPTVLLENHSLKPFHQRVLGTYVVLESSMRTLARDWASLAAAVAADRTTYKQQIPLTWRVPASGPQKIEFLGVGERVVLSPVSGGLRVEWSGKPVTMSMPHFVASEPDIVVSRPEAYWVPAAWPELIERLRLHGIELEVIDEPREVEVGMYRISEDRLAERAFEGRVRVSGTATLERRRETFARGSARVPTAQPLGELAVILLEPSSPDSFFQWGMMVEVLEQTEYVENYVIEPMAERMLAENGELAEEYRRKLLADAKFRSDPRGRLQWFYEQTPFYDERAKLYPVGRE